MTLAWSAAGVATRVSEFPFLQFEVLALELPLVVTLTKADAAGEGALAALTAQIRCALPLLVPLRLLGLSTSGTKA